MQFTIILWMDVYLEKFLFSEKSMSCFFINVLSHIELLSKVKTTSFLRYPQDVLNW